MKLVLAVLDDSNSLESYQEIDMSWVEIFNKDFESQSKDIPEQERKKIYSAEFIDMTSYSVLNSMVTTEDEEQFRVQRGPLKIMLAKLFKYDE